MSRMRLALYSAVCAFTVSLVCLSGPLKAADKAANPAPRPDDPTDPKARKTYFEALDWQKNGRFRIALDLYFKANKQDGGHCIACLDHAYAIALNVGDEKRAEEAAKEWINAAPDDAERAAAHYRLAVALQRQGIAEKKDKCFEQSCGEFKTALQLSPALSGVHFSYGISLAHLKQDDAARAEFAKYLSSPSPDAVFGARAARYVNRIDLARATMAPAFKVTTLDGKQISLDDLAGKVVLIDFWATWCGPCRDALPSIQKIARDLQGQKFVVISVSLDQDEAKWKQFVAQNKMTWPQYRDGGFEGPLARLFAVGAIPSTFSIDSDGVLEDQHVGEASIEGKLKKMVAHAGTEATQQAGAQGPPAP